MRKELPPFENVFFIHYQCEDFKIGDKVLSLSIYAKGMAIEYSKSNEVENIENYFKKIDELQNENLTPIHWNQDRHYYSETHLKDRYNKITDKNINVTYKNSIKLSEYLIDTYGENYIEHPRLDSLAKLNNFYGIREDEKDSRIFPTNRILLLTKIYKNTLKGSLKTRLDTPISKKNENNAPREWDYIKIGVLIATNRLTGTLNKYEYKDKIFNKNDIIKELKKDLKIKSIRQYIEGTFGINTETTYPNDLLRNETKIKKIVEYCKFKNIQITDYYQTLFDNLE